MSQTSPRQSKPSVSPSTPDAHVDEPTAESLSPDEIFHLLQTSRRRDALRYLKEHDDQVRMRDLTDQVAAWENDTTVEGLSSTQRQRVYIPLYQTHLPKLDEAGVIEYDQSRGTVERLPLADELDPYIEGISVGDDEAIPGRAARHPASTDRDWVGYYTGASGLGIALLSGTLLGLPVLSRLSGLIVGAVVSVMFGVLALVHRFERSVTPPAD